MSLPEPRRFDGNPDGAALAGRASDRAAESYVSQCELSAYGRSLHNSHLVAKECAPRELRTAAAAWRSARSRALLELELRRDLEMGGPLCSPPLPHGLARYPLRSGHPLLLLPRIRPTRDYTEVIHSQGAFNPGPRRCMTEGSGTNLVAPLAPGRAAWGLPDLRFNSTARAGLHAQHGHRPPPLARSWRVCRRSRRRRCAPRAQARSATTRGASRQRRSTCAAASNVRSSPLGADMVCNVSCHAARVEALLAGTCFQDQEYLKVPTDCCSFSFNFLHGRRRWERHEPRFYAFRLYELYRFCEGYRRVTARQSAHRHQQSYAQKWIRADGSMG